MVLTRDDTGGQDSTKKAALQKYSAAHKIIFLQKSYQLVAWDRLGLHALRIWVLDMVAGKIRPMLAMPR